MMRSVRITDSTAVAQARRTAQSLGESIGLGDVAGGRLALVATELGSNVLKHGGGGELIVAMAGRGIDVLALDRGPGMADVAACMADGYSTSGTPGNGLGAVRRLAQQFHVASWPGRGTAVLAHVNETGRADDLPAPIAAVVVPKPGEESCGDSWSCHEDAEGRTLFVVDGIGHGPEAARAAHEAVLAFQRHRDAAVADIIEAVHQALRPTRGAAIAVARLDWASSSIAFAGLGNIGSVAVPRQGPLKRMVSHNGTAGHTARRIQSFDYPCSEGLIVMYSDGIGNNWSFDPYPGLVLMPPRLVAGVLYRDAARGRDDAAVLVARTARP